MLRNANESRREADDRTIFGLERVVVAEHLDPGVDQKCPEDVQDPVKALDELDACEDHDHAQDKRHENAPEQYSVSILCRNLEVRKDQQEDKQIVDREGQLDEVSREELLG